MMKKCIQFVVCILIVFAMKCNIAGAETLLAYGGDISSHDQTECGIFTKGIKYYKDNKKYTFKEFKGLVNVWYFTASDQHGKSGACWSGSPWAWSRSTLQRTGNVDNIQYVLREQNCNGLRNITGDDAGYCDEYSDGGYIATFAPGDVVSRDSAAGNKTMWNDWAPGGVFCLKRIKKGEKYLHTTDRFDVSGTNTSGVNHICAYRVYPGSETCNTPFDGWDNAFFGCVSEIPPPGPDVMNRVIPSTLTPYVDEELCMDETGLGRKGCNKDKPKLVSIGSTFDKPVVPLTDGGKAKLYLKYQFAGDIDDTEVLKACSNFATADPKAFDISTIYCAQVPKEDPSKVCACVKRSDDVDPLSLPEIDYCGGNPYLGCVDRPTLEHSKLKLAVEYATNIDTIRGHIYPAIKPVFAKLNANGEVTYIDEAGDNACIKPTYFGAYFKCDANGQATSTFATGKVRIKDRLKLPTADFYIRENIPAYVKNTITCKDSKNNPVIIDYNGEYYKLDTGGKMTSAAAEGAVSCSSGAEAVPLDKARPSSYIRETKSVYGIPYQAMIPVIDKTDKTIQYGRYTSFTDAFGIDRNCTPLKSVSICDVKGKVSFFPAGNRDSTFCNIEDLTSPTCAGYRVSHDPIAIPLYCPGYFTEASKTAAGGKICLGSASNWRYRYIDDYRRKVSLVDPASILAETCLIKESDELCTDIMLGCKKIDGVTKLGGLTSWPAMEYGKGNDTGTCDPAYGLENMISYIFKISQYTKDQVCTNKPAAQSCDDFYDEYVTAAVAVNKDINTKRKEFNEVMFVQMPIEEAFKIMDPLYQKYLKNLGDMIAYYGNFPPIRSCLAGGQSLINYNCAMSYECNPITKEAEHTGFATWSQTQIDSVIKNTTTMNANKGKTVDLVIKGTCGANYKPKDGAATPSRTCTVTYAADGTIAVKSIGKPDTKWKLPIDVPCVPK